MERCMEFNNDRVVRICRYARTPEIFVLQKCPKGTTIETPPLAMSGHHNGNLISQLIDRLSLHPEYHFQDQKDGKMRFCCSLSNDLSL